LQRFHLVLASLAANAASQLFLEMLIRLQNVESRKDMGAGDPPRGLEQRDGQASIVAHRAIAEAIINGDGALARHRMRRHLEAIDAYFRGRQSAGADALAMTDGCF
jgi:DNA-binding FadR family transcriptional regulator